MDILINFFHDTGHILLDNVIPLIVVLGIMIFFHELGHFLVAKLFNVKVLKFALGFGPKIVAREYGETEYSIRYLPLGGFVKMLGENDFDEDDEPVDAKDADRAFNVQNPFKRIAIVAAGPIFNLILAFLLFLGIYMVSGTDIITPEIGKVMDGTPAQKAGLMSGDVIVSIGGKNIKEFEDIRDALKGKAGIPITVKVRRGDKSLSFSLVPEGGVSENEFGQHVKTAYIGFLAKSKHLDLNTVEAFKESLSDTWRWIKLTCMVVVKLFQGEISVKTVGGPIMIGQMTGEIVQTHIASLIPFMAIISINLGILNFFPIPILDGGVILFLIFELILGKPVSMQKREIAMKIGLSLILLLMVVVFYNDILRLFTS